MTSTPLQPAAPPATGSTAAVDGQRKATRSSLDAKLPAFVVSYVGAFMVYGLAAGRPLTIVYGAVVVLLGLAFIALHRRVELTRPLAWALGVLGALHLAGGLIPIERDRVLYNMALGVYPLQVDRVVHAFGAALITLIVWRIMRPMLRRSEGVAWSALAVAGAAGMGVAAMVEPVEFAAATWFGASNVGGYANTGWDLVFDLIGAVSAVAWLGLREMRHSGGSQDRALLVQTDVPPFRKEQLVRTTLWFAIATPFMVGIIVVVSAANTPGYDHISDTVSQLAVNGAPHPGLIGVALALTGLALQGAAWGIRRRSGGVARARTTWIALVISGAAVELGAFVPDDPNTFEVATATGMVHGALVSIAFAAMLLAMFSLTRRTLGVPRSIARFSRGVAMLSLAVGVVFASQLVQPIEGLLQRTLFVLIASWFEVVAFWSLGSDPDRGLEARVQGPRLHRIHTDSIPRSGCASASASAPHVEREPGSSRVPRRTPWPAARQLDLPGRSASTVRARGDVDRRNDRPEGR